MADWPNYYADYMYKNDNYKNNGQFIYYYIVQIFRFFNFSFDGYRFCISLLCLTFYYNFILKFSPIPNLVYASYLSYLIFLDDVQIRNFIACSVFLLAITVIIQHKKNWRIKYFIICSIAACIHNSFWIYLIYLFIPSNLDNTTFVKKIGYIGLGITAIAVFIRPFISNVVLALAIIIGDKASSYSESEIGLGGLIYVAIQLVAIIGTYLIYSNIRKHSNLNNFNNNIRTINKLKIVLMINILSTVCLPPIILAITFNRLIRNIFIVNSVAFTYGIKNKNTRYLSSFIFVLYIFMFIYFELNSPMIQEIVIEPFFNNNIYF